MSTPAAKRSDPSSSGGTSSGGSFPASLPSVACYPPAAWPPRNRSSSTHERGWPSRPAVPRPPEARATNSRRATIKAMGSVFAWLLGSSVALVMWLLLLWAEGRTRDRQGRKKGG